MLRKILLLAAAVALPVGVLTLAVSGGVASAKGKAPNGPVACSISATVNFAAPGISTPGSESTKSTSKTTTANETLGNDGDTCAGTGKALKITSASTECTGNGEPSSNPACTTGGKKQEYGYNSWNNYETTGTSSLSSITSLSFTINSIKYTIGSLSSGATSCSDSNVPGGVEVGFKFTGSVSKPTQDAGQNATLIACLGTTRGNGTTTDCEENFEQCIGGAGTVATADVDPATSSIAIAQSES
jgi:hypothetical protein